MKNQYFGDSRDLFKYDLAISLLVDYGLSKNFTLIPMLTKDSGNTHGSRTGYKSGRPGTLRTELVDFLSKCLKYRKRNVNELNRFFTNYLHDKNLILNIYGGHSEFRDDSRDEYFASLPDKAIKNAIIMLDPDTGIEIKSTTKNREAYVTYEEISKIYERMGKKSMMLIFQFIPRVKRVPYLVGLCKNLEKAVGIKHGINFISDNSIAFFTITKDADYKKTVDFAIRDYSGRYKFTFTRK